MKAVCPKCGWKTRELQDEEVEWVVKGRMRCSGECQKKAVPNAPLTFPPKLKMEENEHGNH